MTKQEHVDPIAKYATAYWGRENAPMAPGHREGWERVIAMVEEEQATELEAVVKRAEKAEDEVMRLKTFIVKARSVLASIDLSEVPPAIAAQEPDQSTQEPLNPPPLGEGKRR